jgi:cytochrome c553
MRKALLIASLLFATAAKADTAYTPDGKLLAPTDYRNWIFLTAGFDLSYVDGPARATHSFGNVFVDRPSYDAFVKTGAWPDKATFVLENRAGSADDPLVKRGQFQAGPVTGMELHVKDAARGGWAFYAFGKDGAPASMIAKTASCYSCHAEHGQTDTTFTQFYPTLAGRAPNTQR